MATYTMGMAAKTLGVSKPTIAKFIREGRLPAVKNDDGSYSIADSDLVAFERSYQRSTKGKRKGEKPADKRGADTVAQSDLAEAERKNLFLQGELDAEKAAAKRDQEYQARRIADLDADKKELIRERDRLRAELASTQERLSEANGKIADITKAVIERGVVPWWQRLLGGKS